MDFLEQVERHSFLGHEWLLWLWYREDQDQALYDLGDERVELLYDDQLVLEGHLAEAEQSRLKGGAPVHAAEARQALRAGKHVTRAKLRLRKAEREWVFQLDTASFSLSTVKLPAVLGQQDEERFFERMMLIEELEDALDAIFAAFLRERLSTEWSQRAASLAAWIQAPVEEG